MARLTGAASRGRAKASGVGIVQRPGPVSAVKRREEGVAINRVGTVGRRSRAVAVDRVLQPVPRRVRDVPDGRDEPNGGDSGPREGGEGIEEQDTEPLRWGVVDKSNLGVEIC